MMHANSSRTSLRRRNRNRPFWFSLFGSLALIVGLTTSALGAAAVFSTPAGAIAQPKVQHSLSDLVKPRAFISFTTVHQTFTVTNFGDDNPAVPGNCPGANCTLRDAVAAANADTGNIDGIVIPSGSTVNVTNAAGVITFTNSMLLDFTGATVDGGGQQIFKMGTATITVQITGGTLTNGNNGGGNGGAIEQDSGALMLNGVTFSSNVSNLGGALFSDGDLWVSNSAFVGNTAPLSGGGIFFSFGSAAFVENTLFQGNGSPEGGGMMNSDGAVTVDDSTFMANNAGPTTAFGFGGGMFTTDLTVGNDDTFDNNSFTHGGEGAGVDNTDVLTLSNSHIDNNSCSGGLVVGCGLADDSANSSAYNNLTVNGTSANAGGGTVQGGAIVLDSNQVLFDGLTVNGTSAIGANVDGGAISTTTNGSISNASISSTTADESLSGGSIDGGAIHNNGQFTYTNVSITGTNATAAFIQGSAFDNSETANISSMNITNTTATASDGNGSVEGGIFSNNDVVSATNLNATGATISADASVLGGLLSNIGQLDATNFTIGSATVNVPGSAVEPNPQADGSILYSEHNMNAINMTVDDVNAAVGSGLGISYGVAISGSQSDAYTNVTIANDNVSGPAGSTFGVFVDDGASLALLNTIVSTSAGCGVSAGGVIDSLGHNLDSGSSCNLTAPGDLQNANPQVQGLADNGGLVLTGALAKTSPAIDDGTNHGCPATDARGVPRPQPPGGTCDIGAFEYVHMGYWMVGNDGGVFAFGDAQFEGSMGGMHLNAPVVGMAATPDVGAGYWLVASDGGIFSFGDALFHGSAGNIHLNKPIVGMAATPDGGGYWLVASDGGIFSYGDATFYGSTGNITLNKPIVGMAATPDGKGYWLVASDGGIFTFGDANFLGSTGNIHLNKPVVGMASTLDGNGYWLVASDGGIFSFGDAIFFGSTGAITLNQPIVAMARGPLGGGYWLFAADGGVFSFGDALFLGSVPGAGAHVTNIVGGTNT